MNGLQVNDKLLFWMNVNLAPDTSTHINPISNEGIT